MKLWHAIFRAGTHTDSGGRTRSYTQSDLDRLVETYDPAKHEAPLVIGHPKDNSPAFGWVKALKRKGDLLLAQFGDVADELAEAVAAGHYRKVSIAIYPDGSLRHVGLLGAMPPAVKGLGSVSFGADQDWRSFEFADPGLEAPNQERNMDELERLRQERDEAQAKARAAEEAAQKATQEKEQADQRAKAAEEAKDQAEKQFAEHQAAQAASARAARFQALLKAGKTLPAEKDKVLAFAEALAKGGELSFSENGKATSQPLEDAFWEFLEARPNHGLLGEFAQEPSGQGGMEYDGSAQAARKF